MDSTSVFIGIDLKSWADTFESVITGVGLIVGGFWTYKLFVKKRGNFPRCTVEHKISCVWVSSNQKLIHIDVKISNLGDLLLPIGPPILRLYDLTCDRNRSGNVSELQYDKTSCEYDWTKLREFDFAWIGDHSEIEPGESQVLNCEHIVQSEVSAVKVYSFVKNLKKKPRTLGWDCTTIHQLIGEVMKTDSMSSNLTRDLADSPIRQVPQKPPPPQPNPIPPPPLPPTQVPPKP